jgi:hypothetical protein
MVRGTTAPAAGSRRARPGVDPVAFGADVRAPEPPSVAPGRPQDAAPPAAGDDHRRRADARLLPALVAVAVAAVHLVTVRAMTVPIIMADEYGYLAAARRIADGGPQTNVPYHPGAGLLYVPATLLGDGPLGAYRLALATNALLAGLLTLAAWWVAAEFAPLRPPARRALAAAAIGLYTSFIGFSSLAAPEVAFAALELGLVGVVARGVRTRAWRWWLVAGLGSGSAWLLHPRGAGVLAAAALVAVLALRPLARHLAAIGAFAASALALVLVTALLDDWVTGPVMDPTQYAAGAFLRRIASTEGIHTVGITVVGQLFYLCAATFGVAVLGAIELVRRAGRGPTRGLEALFPLAALVLVFAISVGSFAHVRRVDQYLYGRYNEGAVAPLLLAGIAVLMAAMPARLLRRHLACAGGATLVTAALFLLVAGSTRLHGPSLSQVMVFGIAPVVRRIGWPNPLLLAAASIAALAVILLSRRLGPLVPVALLTLGFLAFGVQNLRQYLRPSSATRAQEHVIGDVLASLGPPSSLDCVAYDPVGISLYHLPMTRVLVAAPFAPVAPGTGRPCGDLLLAARPLGGLLPQARMVVTETRARLALWALPGPRQDALAARGWLLPAVPATLPQVARATVAATAGSGAPGGTVPVTAHVTATGGAPLPTALGIAWPGPYVTVDAGFPGTPAVRADLVQTLMPGSRGDVALAVPVPPSPAAGRHDLVVRVLAGDRAIATTTVPVTLG